MFKVNLQNSQIFNGIKDDLVSAKAHERLFADIGACLVRRAKDNAHAKGGRTFWGEMANSVSKRVSSSELLVGSSHVAACQKQFGGTISAPGKGAGAKQSQYLSIPLTAKSYAKNPSDFNNLFCLKTRSGNLFLVRNEKSGRKSSSSKKLVFYFLLKKSVEQRAFPWFPLGAEAETEISRGIALWKNRSNH